MLMEISLGQTINILRKNFRIIFYSGFSLAFSTLIFCLTLQPKYSHEVLLRDLDMLDQSSSKLAGLPLDAMSMLTGKPSTAAGNKADALTFLDFTFRKNPVEIKNNDNAYLDRIEDLKGTTYLKIVVIGNSLDEAKIYSEKIVKDLQDYFVEQNQDQASSTKQQSDLIDSQILELERNSETTQKAIKTVGPFPILLEQQAQAQRALLMLQKASTDLKNFLSKREKRIFEVTESRPLSLHPSFPPYLLLTILGFLLGAGFTAFVYLQQDVRRLSAGRQRMETVDAQHDQAA
jgi:hypothetical protein